jgi:hypothetical protein
VIPSQVYKRTKCASAAGAPGWGDSVDVSHSLGLGPHALRLKYWQPRRELTTLPIRLDPAAQQTGLGPMLADLIQQNVEQHPERRSGFDRLRGRVAIASIDAEAAVTMEFLGGKLLVHAGVEHGPDLVISADSITLLELTSARLCFGLPDATHRSGRAVLRKMLSGKLKIRGRGLVLKPLLLVRLNKLLNVASN